MYTCMYLVKEVVNGARVLKRLAFAVLSGEMDQYVRFLPDIQGINIDGQDYALV